MNSVEIIQVVRTTLSRKGSGKDSSSPIRIITEYWDMEGNKLFEVDPCSRVVPVEEDTAALSPQLKPRTETGRTDAK